ncbi:MAG: phospho-N-acetylmuramoyl-pentapeptide-transferase [Planctomycetaceae bacterium]
MLFWLLQHYGHLLESVSARTTGDSRIFLTGRVAAASVTAFVLSIVFGPLAIRWLKSRFRERIASASATLNALHASKQETPTMGGLFVMSAVLLSTLIWGNLQNAFLLLTLSVGILLTAIGAADDWIKQRTTRNGLTARHKLAAQIIVGVVAGIAVFVLQRTDPQAGAIVWPIGSGELALGPWIALWIAFVVVGSANGVNLTDGLDGLAAGCTVFCGAAMTTLVYISGHRELSDYFGVPHVVDSGEVAVTLAALVGAMLGFLWFNCHPADVFMGDAGSLPTGGLLAMAAVISRQELLLVIVGGVFVVETLSVILQVSCFRLTGRRPLRCSPLHNHFVFRGDHENRIVTRFWIASAVLAIIGIACLKLR